MSSSAIKERRKRAVSKAQYPNPVKLLPKKTCKMRQTDPTPDVPASLPSPFFSRGFLIFLSRAGSLWCVKCQGREAQPRNSGRASREALEGLAGSARGFLVTQHPPKGTASRQLSCLAVRQQLALPCPLEPGTSRSGAPLLDSLIPNIHRPGLEKAHSGSF